MALFLINLNLLFANGKITIGRYSLDEIYFPITNYKQMELTFNSFSRIVSLNIYDGIIADLAYRWEIKDNHRKYIFYIRDNIHFHNNTKLQTKDIKKSLEHNIKLSYKILSPEIYKIRGFNNFIKGKSRTLKGIMIDKNRIIFILNTPSYLFLKALTDLNLSVYKISNGKCIGTGPYIPRKFYKKNKEVCRIILKKNQKYFINISDSPNTVELVRNKYYPDIKKYDIILFGRKPEKVPNDFYMEKIPSTIIEILFFNMKSFWGKNRYFRNYLVYSYNFRKIIDKEHLDKYNQPNIIPIGFAFYKNIPLFPHYNKSKSNYFLKKLKIKNHTVKILTVDRLHRKEMAIDLKRHLMKNGFKVKIIEKNFTDFSNNLTNITNEKDTDTDIILAGIFLTIPPFNIDNYLYSVFYPKAESNVGNYKNKKIIKLLKLLKKTSDKIIRKKIIDKIISIYNNDVPIIPLYTRTVYLLYKKSIKPFPFEFSKYIDFRIIKNKK